MSWSKPNMAAGAAWGTLAHPEVAEINATLTPFSSAGSYSLTMLRYYNPGASALHQDVKAINTADKFTAYLFRLYHPRFENLPAGESTSAHLKTLKTQVANLLKQPAGKTLDDLAQLLDRQLVFADELEGTA
ncbi:hypothetical protein ACNKU7_01995 [Microbulbifer sp. SA54]|uniref:hypothetical protein n=1 Tax=Microbulbifer sp. SA54 TaxID=3401577 RepID=UPI003AABA0FA